MLTEIVTPAGSREKKYTLAASMEATYGTYGTESLNPGMSQSEMCSTFRSPLTATSLSQSLPACTQRSFFPVDM
jgi:hypothetical protein